MQLKNYNFYIIIYTASIGVNMEFDNNRLKRNYLDNPLKKGEYPELEDIKYLFLELNLSREECAKICNCNPEKVKIVCQKNKLSKTKEQRTELRRRTTLEKYGCINVSQNKTIKEKKKQTTLENYGVENPAQSKEIYNKIKETCIDRYGVESPSSLEETKQKIRESCLKRYGVKNIMQVFTAKESTESESTEEVISKEALEIKQKIINNIPNMVANIVKTKKKNNSFNTSCIEDKLYKILCKRFSVIRQYSNEQYPFSCDFYLPELDLYIEYNGTWTHGGFPYEDNDICNRQLTRWKEKAKDSKFYKNAIYTWIDLDVRKRNTAKENKLNWLCFYTEKEFMEWYNNICEILQ